MKTNLSSQITLNRVSTRYYRPENAFERSVLTRLEKIPTDIYESAEEGANQIALDIAQIIRDKQRAGRFCVLALAGGNSPRNVYAALVRMHQEEGLSFRNVIVFNLYEYYPMASDAANSNLNALKEMLLDHVDIDKQNIFSPDSTIAKDAIFEYCRLYEQRIESYGGLDVALLGIGRVGNIGFNEPGSRLNSTTRLILLDNASRIFGKDQLNMLEEALRSDPNEYRIFLAHEVVATGGALDQTTVIFGSEAGELLRLFRLMRNYDVSMFFTGHHHKGNEIYSGDGFSEFNAAALHSRSGSFESDGYWYTVTVDPDAGEITVTSYLVTDDSAEPWRITGTDIFPLKTADETGEEEPPVTPPADDTEDGGNEDPGAGDPDPSGDAGDESV